MSGPHLSLSLHHRTCHQVAPDDYPPEMRLERIEDDCGIYACPRCNHKVQVFLAFERDHPAERAESAAHRAHAEAEMQALHASALQAARLSLDPKEAECRTCGHPARNHAIGRWNHVAGRCRAHGCGCGGWT